MTPPPGAPHLPTPSARPPMSSQRALVTILASIGGFLVLCCGGAVAFGVTHPAAKKPAARPATTVPVVAPVATSPAVPATSAAVQTAAPATSAAPTSAPAPSTAPAARPPDQMICRIAEGGGTYYLHVTSASAHRFDACVGHPAYPGTLDDLFAIANMDRRCILGNDYTASHEAIVGVYSDTAGPNLSAARAFCATYGGE